MRIYKAKTFARFARSERISDASLKDAVERAEAGLVDADLGGGLIKQRVARQGKGRSGGYRTLLAFRAGNGTAVFLYGFAKSERGNIDQAELDDLRLIAGRLLADPFRIAKNVDDGTLIEVNDDDQS